MKKIHTEKSVKLLPCIFMLIFIAGITAGALFARFSAGSDFSVPASSGKSSLFVRSFSSFVKPCIVIWLSCLSNASVYFSSAVLAYRGGIIGFVTAWVMKFHGIGPAVCVTLPQNILFFPFLLFISLAAYTGQKKLSPAEFLIIFALIPAVCALCALIDTYVTTVLIKYIFY